MVFWVFITSIRCILIYDFPGFYFGILKPQSKAVCKIKYIDVSNTMKSSSVGWIAGSADCPGWNAVGFGAPARWLTWLSHRLRS